MFNLLSKLMAQGILPVKVGKRHIAAGVIGNPMTHPLALAINEMPAFSDARVLHGKGECTFAMVQRTIIGKIRLRCTVSADDTFTGGLVAVGEGKTVRFNLVVGSMAIELGPEGIATVSDDDGDDYGDDEPPVIQVIKGRKVNVSL